MNYKKNALYIAGAFMALAVTSSVHAHVVNVTVTINDSETPDLMECEKRHKPNKNPVLSKAGESHEYAKKHLKEGESPEFSRDKEKRMAKGKCRIENGKHSARDQPPVNDQPPAKDQ